MIPDDKVERTPLEIMYHSSFSLSSIKNSICGRRVAPKDMEGAYNELSKIRENLDIAFNAISNFKETETLHTKEVIGELKKLHSEIVDVEGEMSSSAKIHEVSKSIDHLINRILIKTSRMLIEENKRQIAEIGREPLKLHLSPDKTRTARIKRIESENIEIEEEIKNCEGQSVGSKKKADAYQLFASSSERHKKAKIEAKELQGDADKESVWSRFNKCYEYYEESGFDFQLQPYFYLKKEGGAVTLCCDPIGALLSSRRSDKKEIFERLESGAVGEVTYVADPFEVAEYLANARPTLAEKALIQPYLLFLEELLHRPTQVYTLEDQLKAESIRRTLRLLRPMAEETKMEGCLHLLAQSQKEADIIAKGLAQEMSLELGRPVDLKSLIVAYELYMNGEAKGTATHSEFWIGGNSKKEEEYYDSSDKSHHFAIELTPQPNEEWVIYGDIEEGDSLRKSLLADVDSSYKIRDPNKKIIFNGSFNSGENSSLEIFYILLRLKIANPHQVFIVQDRDDPYRDSREKFMDELIRSASALEGGDEVNFDRFKLFYTTLPTALAFRLQDDRIALLCNDEIKLKSNLHAAQREYLAPLYYIDIESKALLSEIHEGEVNRTVKFKYGTSGAMRVVFDEKGSFPKERMDDLKAYVDPVEIESLAKRRGMEFDYSNRERHIYLTSPQFISSPRHHEIQYLNSFISEVSHIVDSAPPGDKLSAIYSKEETELSDLRALYSEAPESIKKVAQSYKFHLMPKQELLIPTIDYLCEAMPNMSSEARKPLVGIKILTWDRHLRVQEEKSALKEPTPPTIVIYLLAESPDEAQKSLDELFKAFEQRDDLKEGRDITPRFNAKCSSLIYVAQGTGPDKEIKSSLLEEVKTLRERRNGEVDPFVKKMLTRELKRKELEMQTPFLFDDDMAFFVSDLTGKEVDYRLHHPLNSEEKLYGDAVDNGTEAFKKKLQKMVEEG